MVELIGDGRQDLSATRGGKTQDAQRFALGGIALILAQMFDVFDQGDMKPSGIL